MSDGLSCLPINEGGDLSLVIIDEGELGQVVTCVMSMGHLHHYLPHVLVWVDLQLLSTDYYTPLGLLEVILGCDVLVHVPPQAIYAITIGHIQCL